MKNYLFYLVLLMAVSLKGQQYIGLNKIALHDSLKKHNTYFKPDNSTINKTFKYVKYIDSVNEQTWLFFLNDENVCTHHKLMSDYSNFQTILEKLDEKNIKMNKNEWEYKEHNKVFQVTLTEGDWFFTVLTREK